jgi:diketogulonate reductase-like aldo/keto reductase
MERYEARKAVLEDLEAQGLLVKTVPHTHMVGTHDRCKTTVEPLVKPQWFVKMEEMAKPAKEAVEQGKIRSLGLSNWYVKELTSFLPQVTITPALVQNEIHPYYQEQDVVPFIQDKGIVVQCWYPLGGRGYTAELLGDETICAIAEAHGVSAAQVILRWDLQRGIVVIPGSGNEQHIIENLDLFGFELTPEEMEQIAALDRSEKHDWY